MDSIKSKKCEIYFGCILMISFNVGVDCALPDCRIRAKFAFESTIAFVGAFVNLVGRKRMVGGEVAFRALENLWAALLSA